MTELLENYRKNKPAIVLTVLIAVTIFSAFMASGFQTSFGQVDVSLVQITDANGLRIVGKLYKPVGVDAANPAPGILGMHGFNNDKDVQRPAALELARAGFVVISVDYAGHGDSQSGYTTDSSPSSYALMYEFLMNLTFVQGNNTGIYGHSAGNIRAVILAGLYPQHRALALQSFVPESYAAYGSYGDPKYHNILHLWAAWEEWGSEGRGPSQVLAESLVVIDNTYHLTPGTAAVDTNLNLWGGPADFANGSARRHAYDLGTHPYITMSPKHTSEIVAWMLQALQGMSYSEAWAIADVSNQIWVGTEVFGLIACFCTMLAILPLAYLLLNTKFFGEVKQKMPERIQTTKGSTWWIAATINVVICGYTYWYFTSGYGNSGAAKNWLFDVKIGDLSVFPFGVANGFAVWFLLNAILMVVLWSTWYLLTRWRKGRDSISLYDMGLTFSKKEELEGLSLPKKLFTAFNPRIIAKTALLAFILFAFMYASVYWSAQFLNIEFRGFWAFMKPFHGVKRAVYFWPYFGIVLFFALFNAGVFMYGQLRMKEYKNTYVTHAVWWVKYMYLMLGGLIACIAIQYGPQMFFDQPVASTADPTWIYGSTTRMMVVQLMGAIPLLALIYFICINLYRQTGRIYLSSIMFAVILVWFQMTALAAHV